MSLKAILLCAGSSKRFGIENKLLCEFHGTPICALTLNNLLDSSVEHIVVVTGHESDQVISALKKHCDLGPFNERVRLVHNPLFASGMGSSLVAALSHVKDAEAIIVCLGDMPQIDSHVVDDLYSAWKDNTNFLAAVPMLDGKRGNPVLLASCIYDQLLTITGDSGARHILAQINDLVLEVPVNNHGIFKDIDVKSDLI